MTLCLFSSQLKAELIEATDVQLVTANCTVCHSSSVIESARLSRDKWLETIRWMQEKHNLWPLGDNESKIVDYLSRYYGVDRDDKAKALAAANKTLVSNRRRKNLILRHEN